MAAAWSLSEVRAAMASTGKRSLNESGARFRSSIAVWFRVLTALPFHELVSANVSKRMLPCPWHVDEPKHGTQGTVPVSADCECSQPAYNDDAKSHIPAESGAKKTTSKSPENPGATQSNQA